MRKLTLVLFFIALTCSYAGARNYYILSVGISDYPGERNDLSLPTADAKMFASTFKKSNNAHVLLLTNEKATRQNISSKARTLFSQAKEDDVIIFFFSGHGSPGSFVAYDEFMPYDDIRRAFAVSKAKSKMIFADACFAGDMREGGSSNHHEVGSDVMLFLSSRDDETSIENSTMKNGFFTACLTRCLKGAADLNRDKVITARELFQEVHRGVVELSRDRQHPVMWGNFSDNMTVISWK